MWDHHERSGHCKVQRSRGAGSRHCGSWVLLGCSSVHRTILQVLCRCGTGPGRMEVILVFWEVGVIVVGILEETVGVVSVDGAVETCLDSLEQVLAEVDVSLSKQVSEV